MPGSIRVSVLEAFDLPEAIADGEEVAIKVAVGAREFQTPLNQTFGGKTTPWSLDFVFPVLNLRDSLLVMLLHKNGEMISKNEIDTPSIVEKGSFDVDLLLNGGGNIHLSLSFVLTDEERRRIDIMRAAALKRREQEALKSTTNPQLGEKESEIMPSDPLLSAPVVEPEKEEEFEASKDFSLAVLQESGESQSNKSDRKIQELSTGPEPVGELDSTGQYSSEKTSGTESISLEDPAKISQTVADQLNLDLSATTEIPAQACVYSELEEQTASENSGESLEDSAEMNHVKPGPNSVKDKIKAFETTKPKGAIKQGLTLPSTMDMHMSNPQFKNSPRKYIESTAEQEALSKDRNLIDTDRMDNKEIDSQDQLGSVEPVKNVCESNETTSAASGAYYSDCVPEKEGKEPGSNVESVANVNPVETNERDIQREKTLVTASKQKRRHIDLHDVSKQVINGAIVGAVSGVVLIAAGALLWARNPNKRRNTRLGQQISKQRMRK